MKASEVVTRSPPYPKRSRWGQSDCTPNKLLRNVHWHIVWMRLNWSFEQENDPTDFHGTIHP